MENSASQNGPRKNAKLPETTQHEHVVDLLTEFYALMGNAPETVGAVNAMAHALLVQHRVTADEISRALFALERCKYPVRLPHILEQIELQDGRPDPEQAWAMCPKSEEQSVIWTNEMACAYGISRGLDEVAARMAFKSAYQEAVAIARKNHEPIRWTVSLGFDKADRVRVIAQAVSEGKMLSEHALTLLGEQREELLLALPPAVTKALPGEVRKVRDLSKLTGLHRAVAEWVEATGRSFPEEESRFPNGNPKLNPALVQARALGSIGCDAKTSKSSSVSGKS